VRSSACEAIAAMPAASREPFRLSIGPSGSWPMISGSVAAF